MDQFYYLIYLCVVLFSSILIKTVGKIDIDFKKAIIAILPVLIIFVIWDILATERGHWSFGFDKMLGIVIINQPLEEIAFFIVIPLFYLVVWESIKKYKKVFRWNTR